ncbi:N-terminal binuclear Zn cluster-containing/DNA binding domain-containing protein [Trichoderma citrinoviride]|uniref:N-terminal binuclear Zn cluster-containing/DNA binding domain-containing protein n=1 Tax=Trichoderma citrinoviride TaxID=58853 RepID=A0A2T4B9W0_9HYPO|nr:N-terminal binuclear Zn cluster-containing/DNA binding domain-containing protein [Trichoderma citrinoviride]PTB66107.1 N-terminal binuclear Zn cluster-containing/DNA binding domain-containing protein [Trichoderma citrinoviride]
MDPGKTMTKRGRGRSVTACLECRKLKKKCDRQWPCNHCSSRQIPHRCRFTQATQNQQQMSASTDTPEDSDQAMSPASAMHMLGYMYAKNDAVFGGITPKAQYTESPNAVPEPVLKASRIVSPRPYTDVLIKNFFDNVNYHYGILHQPSFMIAYVNWWSHRRRAQSESAIGLTCLILRICANSSQFLSQETSLQLEVDLGDSVQNLSRTYHDAAQTISAFLSPRCGDLVNAQQSFLAATWHKGEADFVRSWHELGATVRLVQEMSVHIDVHSEEINEFDLEMRRRLWCALYTWERYMAANFNRPPMIQSDTTVPLPNPKLDHQRTLPEVPSLIVAKLLENQLARQLEEGDRADGTHGPGKLEFVEAWMSSLPPAFRVVDPVKRWDGEYPYIPFQRLQLHCVGYMTQLLLLRSTLITSGAFSEISFAGARITPETMMLLHRIVDLSLQAMAVSKDIFELCFPQHSKYFMVAFCPFDNAALLCSLLMHDVSRTVIPRRMEVVHAVGQALHISRRLRGFTRMGDATWSILSTFRDRINLTLLGRELIEETEVTGKIRRRSTGSGVGSPPESDDRFEAFSNEELRLLEDNLAADSAGILGIDLGTLDGVWNWERVGF